jgi:hypothetical protein
MRAMRKVFHSTDGFLNFFQKHTLLHYTSSIAMQKPIFISSLSNLSTSVRTKQTKHVAPQHLFSKFAVWDSHGRGREEFLSF